LYRELEICTEQEQLREYLDDLCHKFKCCTRMLNIKDTQFKAEINSNGNSSPKQSFYTNFKCCTWCSLNYFNDRTDANKIMIDSHRSNLYLRQPFKKVSMSFGSNDTNANMLKLKKVKKKVDQVNASSTIKTRSSNVERQNLITSAKLQQELIECEKQQIERVKLKSKLEQRQLLKLSKSNRQQEHKRQQQIDKSSKRAMLKKPDKPIKTTFKTKIRVNKQNKSLENIKICNQVEKNDSFAVSPSRQNPSLNVSLPISTSFSLLNNQSTLFNDSSTSNLNYSLKVETPKNSYISNANMANIYNETKISNMSNGFAFQEPVIEVKSNPMHWSIGEVCKYLQDNEFDSKIVYLIEEHEIDGQSFLMLSLPTMLNYMKLKLGPAVKLADMVSKLKQVYIQKYKVEDSLLNPVSASTLR